MAFRRKNRESVDGPEGPFLPRSAYATSTADGEREMVQAILPPASPDVREVLLHYYVSAKTWPLILLIGQPAEQLRLVFQFLSEGIAGCSDGQIHLLPAQFPWQEQAGDNPYLDSIRGRFNTMAFLDLLAEAGTPGNESRGYFLCLEQAMPAELDAYIDLYLAPQQGKRARPSLPPNLYLTAILSMDGGIWCLPAFLLNQVGIVEVTKPLDRQNGAPICPPVGWQRLFLRHTVRDPSRARRRLQRLGLWQKTLDMLDVVQAHTPLPIDSALKTGLLLYIANSFTTDGEGLFQEAGEQNIRQALDLQLSQRLLPCAEQWSWNRDHWEQLLPRLEEAFPRAFARASHIMTEHSPDTESTVPAVAPFSVEKKKSNDS